MMQRKCLLLMLLLLPLVVPMLALSSGMARASRMGWTWSPGVGTTRRRHWRMSLGAHSAGDGGGREGIAAHKAAMAGFDLKAALVYTDDDLVVVNKPPNALCVPGRYIQDSLVMRVAEHFSIQDYARMVVHRLDQATSGLVVFAKHEGALKSLHAQLREKAAAAREAGGGPAAVEKGYTALVSCARGPLDPPEGRITLPVRKDMDNAPKQMVDMDAGKPCLTLYRVRRRGPDRCLVGLQPVTGRTHQLRVHLSAIGHPIHGDTFYAPYIVQTRSPDRLCLHADTIEFVHPRTAERVRFHCPYPPEWDEGLEEAMPDP